MRYRLQVMRKIVVGLLFMFDGIMAVDDDAEVVDGVFQFDYHHLKFKARTICKELNKLNFNISANDALFLCRDEMLFVVKLENSKDTDPGNSLLLMQQFSTFGLTPIMSIYNETFSTSFMFNSKLNFTLLGWTLVLSRQGITGSTSVPPISLLPYTVVIEFPNHLYRTKTLLRDFFAEPFFKWTICCSISPDYLRKYIDFLQFLEPPCESSKVFTLAVVHSSFEGIVVGLSNNNQILYYNLASLNNKQICGAALTDCKDLYLLDAVLTTHHLIFVTTKGVLVSNDLMVFSSTKPEMMTFKLIFTLPRIHERFWGIEGRKQVELKSNVECEYHYVNHPHIKETVFFTVSNQRSIYMSNRPYANWKLISLRKDKNESLVALTFDWHRQQFIILEKAVTNSNQISVMQYPSLVRLCVYVFPTSLTASTVLIHPTSRHIIVVGNEVWISEDNGVFFRNIYYMSEDMIKPLSNHMSPSGEFAFVTNNGSLLYGKIGYLTNRTPVCERMVIQTAVIIFQTHISIPRMISTKLTTTSLDGLVLYNIYKIFINSTIINIQEFRKFKADFALENYHVSIATMLTEAESVAPSYFCLQYLSAKEAILYEYETFPSNDVYGKPYIGKLLKHKSGGEAIIKDVIPTPGMQFKNALMLNVLEQFTPESKIDFQFEIEDSATNTLMLMTLSDYLWTKEDVGKTVAFSGFPSILLTNLISSTEMEGISVNTNASVWAGWKGDSYLYSFTSNNESLLELAEDNCRFSVDVYRDSIHVVENNKFIIDLKDKLQLDIEINSLHHDYAAIRDVKVYSILKNSRLFSISGKQERQATKIILSLNISAVAKSDGLSALIVSMPDVSLKCTPSVHFVIYSFCPESKVFQLNYTLIPNITTYNYESLPINYRPPSQFGVAVPTSQHIYNADPSVPRWQDKTLISQATGEFKQCKNKTEKKHCDCTELMEESPLVVYSDCKRKVKQIRHLTYILLNFTLLKQQNQLDWASFVSLTELNQRKDYSVLLPDDVEVIPDAQNMTGFSNNARLLLKGSGLYHFRVHLHSDRSKCNLTDEFQVYAVPLSLPYPFYYMWNCLVVITTGVVLLATYIWYTIAHQSTNRFQRQHQVKSSSAQSTTMVSREL